jgi:hypothetical protein
LASYFKFVLALLAALADAAMAVELVEPTTSAPFSTLPIHARIFLATLGIQNLMLIADLPTHIPENLDQTAQV